MVRSISGRHAAAANELDAPAIGHPVEQDQTPSTGRGLASRLDALGVEAGARVVHLGTRTFLADGQHRTSRSVSCRPRSSAVPDAVRDQLAHQQAQVLVQRRVDLLARAIDGISGLGRAGATLPPGSSKRCRRRGCGVISGAVAHEHHTSPATRHDSLDPFLDEASGLSRPFAIEVRLAGAAPPAWPVGRVLPAAEGACPAPRVYRRSGRRRDLRARRSPAPFRRRGRLHDPGQEAAGVGALGGAPPARACPEATSLPPSSPPSGPRSMMRSAVLITSRLCSITTTVLPCSTSRPSISSRRCTSAKCRPVVGSSRM